MDDGICEKPQRALTAQRDKFDMDEYDAEMRALPPRDMHRVTWLSLNRYSTAFVGSLPVGDNIIEGPQLEIAYEMYYNAPCKVCRAHIGKETRKARGNMPAEQLGEYGHELGRSAGKDLNDVRHDDAKWALGDLLREMEIPHEVEPYSLFVGVMNQAGNVKKRRRTK